MSNYDIKKFYDRVNINKIEEIIFDHQNENIEEYKEIFQVFKNLSKEGLPQGPLFSHFFAALLLYDLPKEFKKKFPDCEIIYYVDDINVFYNVVDEKSKMNANQKYSEISIYLNEYLKTKLIEDGNEFFKYR